jgi:hypothetical protein
MKRAKGGSGKVRSDQDQDEFQQVSKDEFVDRWRVEMVGGEVFYQPEVCIL